MQSYYMCLLLYWFFFFEECYGTPEIHHYFILDGIGIAYHLKSDICHRMHASKNLVTKPLYVFVFLKTLYTTIMVKKAEFCMG
mmetsp:Transcript_13077/g.18793  ORF Transcript_13077/g.18793 Transcript_13077/m.18793 type:complete len:83 (+) Transcript_13077:159-407(+)